MKEVVVEDNVFDTVCEDRPEQSVFEITFEDNVFEGNVLAILLE